MTKETKPPEPKVTQEDFSKVFGLPDNSATRNSKGVSLKVDVLSGITGPMQDFIPESDPDYVCSLTEMKMAMVAHVVNMPMYIWGPHGTGKSTLVEQFCAKTGRPLMRVQHTVSTEESHILGHYVIRGGATVFELGPLPIAMRDGLVYLADEYDFALPSVTSVYHPVLEGKALFIKEAPPELRVIKPHPNFRFYASGNTNGAGDDTGLYQGTNIMNAANFSRFGITLKMEYVNERQEAAMIASKSLIHIDDAQKLVAVAKEVRKQFEEGKLAMTVSPRELINAARLARRFGTIPNLSLGVEYAFANRLTPTDRKSVMDFVQRFCVTAPTGAI